MEYKFEYYFEDVLADNEMYCVVINGIYYPQWSLIDSKFNWTIIE
jgi:hypothetical protein